MFVFKTSGNYAPCNIYITQAGGGGLWWPAGFLFIIVGVWVFTVDIIWYDMISICGVVESRFWEKMTWPSNWQECYLACIIWRRYSNWQRNLFQISLTKLYFLKCIVIIIPPPPPSRPIVNFEYNRSSHIQKTSNHMTGCCHSNRVINVVISWTASCEASANHIDQASLVLGTKILKLQTDRNASCFCQAYIHMPCPKFTKNLPREGRH